MPFITRARLYELEAAFEAQEQQDEAERKARLDYSKNLKRETTKLQEQHEDTLLNVRKQHKTELRKIQEDRDTAVEEAQKAVKIAAKDRDEKVADAKAALAIIEKQRDALQEIVDNAGELTELEYKLNGRESELNAREEVLKTREDAVTKAEKAFASKVEAHAKEVTDARNEGEKVGERKGYANGSADMARTIGDLTKNATDHAQKMGDKAQDALIAAAKKDVPQPTVTMLPVPTAQPTINNSNVQ